MTTIPQSELPALIEPFVNARLNRVRNPETGYYEPRKSGVGIRYGVSPILDSYMGDADVRAVTSEGVEVFFYSGTELIPWDAVKAVDIFDMDKKGDMMIRERFVPAEDWCAEMERGA